MGEPSHSCHQMLPTIAHRLTKYLLAHQLVTLIKRYDPNTVRQRTGHLVGECSKTSVSRERHLVIFLIKNRQVALKSFGL